MSTSLKIAELNQKLQALVNKTYEVLETTDNQELKEDLKQELKALENRTDLRVSFVGQYSSGKSTIISALTGNKDIKIDANVSTDIVSEYRWNNIVLMDTPGILAGKVEKHDERTKEALKNSDLIVYVLTSQLFDDVVFENFIDLAYVQQLKDKMLIVINKMSMETGEFNVLKENYTQSIKTIFEERGYNFDFEVVFIDAADYIEGKDDDDEEFIQLSNFNTFISTLNSFVQRKGVIKKQFDSPVRLLRSKLSDIILAEVEPHLQTVLGQYKRQLLASQKDVQNRVELEIEKFRNMIVSKGNPIADSIGTKEGTEDNIKAEYSNLEKFIEGEIEELDRRLKDIIEKEEQEFLEGVEELNNKKVIVEYRDRIDRELEKPNITIEQQINLEKQKKYLNFVQQGSNQVVSMSIKGASKGFLANVAASSGTQTHSIIYNVGKFFGHKFKPWGAVKLASRLGNFAKIAGRIAPFVVVGLELWAKKKEEDARKEIASAKNQFLNGVKEFADDISHEIRNAFIDYIDNSYNERVSAMDAQQAEIVKTQETNSEFSEMIQKLDAEYIDFIEVVESA